MLNYYSILDLDGDARPPTGVVPVSVMVAGSGSTLSPYAPVFVPNSFSPGTKPVYSDPHWQEEDQGWQSVTRGRSFNPGHLKFQVAKDLSPRKPYPEMPYKFDAIHQKGPHVTGQGSRRVASRTKKPCRPRNKKNTGKPKHLDHNSPKLGGIDVNELETSLFEELILQELNLTNLPSHCIAPGNGSARSFARLKASRNNRSIPSACEFAKPSTG